MSVLLDALKKSEEEKKKTEDSPGSSSETADAAGTEVVQAEVSESQQVPTQHPSGGTPTPKASVGGGGIGKLGMFSQPKPPVSRPTPPKAPRPPAVRGQPASSAPPASPPAGTPRSAPPPPPAAGSSPAPARPKLQAQDDDASTFDFDAIDDPVPSPSTTLSGLGVSAAAPVSATARAGSIVGAGESAVETGSAVSEGRRFLLPLAAVVVLGIGGYSYFQFGGGGSGSVTSSAPQGDSATGDSVSETIVAAAPADQLPLPSPRVDIQRELINFASYSGDNQQLDGVVNEQEVAERIATLTSGLFAEPEQPVVVEEEVLAVDLDIDGGVEEESAAQAHELSVTDFPLTSAEASQANLALELSNVDLGEGVRIFSVASLTGNEAEAAKKSGSRSTTSSVQEISSSEAVIEVSKKGAMITDMLDEAKSHYDSGDLDGAEQTFRKILAEVPNNLNAMKGLAMVASESGRYRLSASIYLKVLELSPNDPVAISELISIHAVQPNSRLTKERLRSLIGRVPSQDGRVFFALGNLSAGEQDWHGAQASYFRALSAEPSNPDYAYNLAVSLEYLNKQRVALQYYRMARDLAVKAPHGFDGSVLATRILQLDS